MALHRPERPVTSRPTPALEPLEGRTLFAAVLPLVTADVVGGTLQVVGTRLSDVITVVPSATNPNAIEVHSGTSFVGAFDTVAVNSIRIEGVNGHDVLSVDAALVIPAVLVGGNGRDTLTGGSGADTLEGDNGRDTLNGGNGDDTLFGGNAKDALDGGGGNDTLSGGRGRDLVTGGAGTDTYTGDKASELLDKADDESILLPPSGSRT
jgi:Ca2+-binding RTX toxin-like protein